MLNKEAIINEKSNPFYATRQMFSTYIDSEELKTYEDWLALPDEDKAAALFVIFFETITFAWYKVKTAFVEDSDGVSTILQYLQKNVEKIKADPKRYNVKYIYRVAYNCLDCLRYVLRDKRRFENERSNIEYTTDGEVDLFDTVPDTDEVFYKVFEDEEKSKFWEIIENMDKDTKTVVSELLDERKSKSTRISEEKRTEIILNLREKLGEFQVGFSF